MSISKWKVLVCWMPSCLPDIALTASLSINYYNWFHWDDSGRLEGCVPVCFKCISPDLILKHLLWFWWNGCHKLNPDINFYFLVAVVDVLTEFFQDDRGWFNFSNEGWFSGLRRKEGRQTLPMASWRIWKSMWPHCKHIQELYPAPPSWQLSSSVLHLQFLQLL
jgi:hypothetical protein